jgi:hypothetical protein
VLTVSPKDGRPGTNQVPATLLHAVEKPGRVRLDFADGLAVEVPQPAFAKYPSVKDWVIEFPRSSLRIL